MKVKPLTLLGAGSCAALLCLAAPAWAKTPAPPPAPEDPKPAGASVRVDFDVAGPPLLAADELTEAYTRAQACTPADGQGQEGWALARATILAAYPAVQSNDLKGAWTLPPLADLRAIPAEGDPRCKDGFDRSTLVKGPDLGSLELGGAQPDTLLRGLSNFLVERAQIELGAWVFSSLEDQLCGDPPKGKESLDETRPFEVLPDTCALVRANTLRFTSAGIGVLRGTARADLISLPRRTVQQRAEQLPEMGDESLQQRGALLSTAVLLRMAELLSDGADPLEVISAWPRSTPWQKEWSTLGAAPITLYAVGVMTAAIPREGDEALVPDTANLQQALPAFVLATLINLNEQGALEPLSKALNPKGGGTAQATLIAPLQAAHRGLFRSVTQLADRVKTLRSLPADAPPERRRAAGVQVALGSMNIAGQGLQLIRSVAEKNGAAGTVANLRTAERWLSAVQGITSGLAGGDLGALSAAVTTLLMDVLPTPEGDPPNELNEAAVKALAFASALGQAEDAQSAQAAIESFVAPPGGYARKRLDYAGTDRYLTLQSYVGLAAGGEVVLAGGGPKLGGAAAPFVSLGAEVGRGTEKGRAIGAYVSVLDLGGVAAVHFGSDVATAPVNIRQVLSPGLYFTQGLQKSPVSWGLGASLRPGLRGNEDSPNNALQLGAFVAMDLVLLP